MKRIAGAGFAAGAALIVGLSLAGASGGEEPPDGWIVDAMAAPTLISYSGTVEVVRFGRNGSEASVYRIQHRAPNLTQRIYTSPDSLRGDEVVTRGDDSFAVDVQRHRIVETKNQASDDQIARDDNYLLLRANYRAVSQGSQTIDGRDVRDVALINKYTHASTMLVRIDAATKLALEKEQYASDGAMVSQVRFQDVRYGVTIPDSAFAVPSAYTTVRDTNIGKPSDDVDAVVRDAGFSARCPHALPEGFTAVEGRIVHPKHLPTVHVLYSDGIRTVSLFEYSGSRALDLAGADPVATSVGGHEAHYLERGAATLLTWNDDALHYTLVGDLTLQELQKLAQSI